MELTLDQALQKGVEAHKAGKAQEADRYYTAILKANPKHPDANHNMGVLAVGVGKVEEALPFFKKALEANSSTGQYWLSFIDALIKLERMDNAKAVLEQAKSKGAKGDGFDKLEAQLEGVKPSETTAPQNQKPKTKNQDLTQDQFQPLMVLYSHGQYQKALDMISQLLQKFPNSVNLYNIQGAANAGIYQFDAAIDSYKKAIDIKPDYADAYNNMGNALKKQGKLDEAIDAYNKALSIKPNNADAYNNMGTALKKQGKLDEAIDAYNKSLSIKPNNAEAHNNMGNALQEKGKLEEAIEAYNKSLSIKPNNAEAHNNMGNALQEQGKLEEAIDAYNKSLSIEPDHAGTYKNTTALLKTYSLKSERCHDLFNIDSKIKKLSPRISNATSNEEIIDNLAIGLSYITEESFEYKTHLSQIYKRNTIDLNCKRHMKIFNTKDIIPKFCFGCFKVQVEVGTFIDLIKLTSLFYKFDFEKDLTRKTMIELRPNISGYYKGLFYCNGLDQAKAVKSSLDSSLKEIFGEKIKSNIKRGCSEYPLKFPTYGEIPRNPKNIMSFPKDWRLSEENFDQNELIKPKDNQMASLLEFCLSDFYIIQKWIDYAKGIGDQSIEIFDDRPIVFKDIYEKAKIRAIS